MGDGRGARRHTYLAVDVVVFTVDDGRLEVLLVCAASGPYRGKWAFPGRLVGVDEPLEVAADDELKSLLGHRAFYVEQIRTFGDPGRDPRGRVASTAYLALVSSKPRRRCSDRYADCRWVRVGDLPSLAYDHDEMARCALERLRSKVEYTNIVYALLPAEFTLSELQDLYETVLDRRLDRRNFRKKLGESGLLRALPRQRRGPHRPATLYTFASRRPTPVRIV